ncbi:MAG: hypothetical protein NTV51_12880 [Verrucomicrobia bacterium]|nr:hypothetical protein [Verrucomicrobiota bacterium]
MDTPTHPHDIALGDPLTEITRKERRNLIGLSAVGLFVAWAGLVPSKISALGIEFNKTEQEYFKIGISFGVLYFTAAFGLYAWSDFLVWRLRQIRSVNAQAAASAEKEVGLFGASGAYEQVRKMELDRLGKDTLFKFPLLTRIFSSATRPTAMVRAGFDFLFPLVLGVVAFFSLIK